MATDGNRFSDEQVMAWFKIGATIPGLEETRAAIPKSGAGYIRQERPPAAPGVPLKKPPSRPSNNYDSSDEDGIKGITINPYNHSIISTYNNGLSGQPSKHHNPTKLKEEELDAYSHQYNKGLPVKEQKRITLEENGVYSRYSFDHQYNKSLPITEKRQAILDTINYYPVTIIQGETGSGKTTQVPQYIMDQCAKENTHCNIICTQPRRIATTSIAKFICKERNWQLGNLVGYQIQLDKRTSEDTRLTFCTTGVLLQKLVNQRNLNEYTHVILDEVHERDKDTDFCLLLVRHFQNINSPFVKIILMSATIDSSMFANYFTTSEGPAPVVDISGKSFPVTEVYLDSLIRFAATESYSPFDVDDAKLHPEMVDLAANLIQRLDEEIELFGQQSHVGNPAIRGTVLVFLPGLPEIKFFDQVLQERCADSKLTIVPLHSSITHDEQLKAFLNPTEGKRKVILATNIAESSITVPDIRYVIDFGLVKELTCDPYTNYQCLKLRWASKASMTQRKGRAGRVASGMCFRLMEKDFYIKWCSDHSTPEMLRCPLESLVLNVKVLDIGEPRSILRLALEPPHLSDIEKTILNLKEAGALTAFINGVSNPYNGNLTFLGRVLSGLPIDVHLGKLCVLGHTFGCLEEAIVVASALSLKSMFIHPYKRPMEGYKSKMSWAEDHFSDCIAIVVAFKEWKNAKINGRFDLGGKEEKSWCQRNLINRSVIKEVSELVEDLTRRLTKHNIIPQRSVLSKPLHSSPHEYFIFKVVLAGAFYPNYFTWKISDEEVSLRQMSGLDPTTTVMLSGLPPHPHQYRALLCQMFGAYGKGKALHFDGSRCYVEYERTRPSQNRYSSVGDARNVIPAVYLAVKAWQLKVTHVLFSSESADEALSQVEQKGGSKNLWMLSGKPREVEPPASKQNFKLSPVPLPKLGYIQVTVTEMIDAGHFWAQLSDAVALSNLAAMVVTIETTQLTLLSRPEEQHIGTFCLANFSVDKKYYRARIEDISAGTAHVVFVDYGNMEVIPFSSLRQLPANLATLPIQAFECFLSEIRPSHELSSEGKWTADANNLFHQLTTNKPLIAQIYSKIGDDVLRVRLWDTIGDKDIFVNKLLVEEGYAERMEEPYQSKHLHLLAQQEQHNADTLGIASMQTPQNSGNQPRASHIAAVGSSRRSEPWNIADQPHTRCQKTGIYPSGSGQIRQWSLKGPSNPYEVSYYSMCKIGRTKGVRVERDSVNSITIDNEPQDKHERIMIAAHVGLNPSGNTMVLRDTTLMPNIHGLASLICLLFAPTVEMRTDEEVSQYTGVLCGLGWDPSTGKGLYEDHDIECTFDTVFTQEDFDQINNLRSALNLVICEEGYSEWGVSGLTKLQKKTRDLLLRVFLNKRKSTTPLHYKSAYKWNQVPQQYIMYPGLKNAKTEDENENEDLCIYPLHSGITFSESDVDRKKSAQERIKSLYKKASKSELPEQIYCEFCNVTCASPRELFKHLYSREHKEQEELIMNE